MTRKSICISFFLFLAYNLLLILFPPSGSVSQNLWQSNMIKAQNYIYEGSKNEVAVVGSSLAAHLEADLLPENAVNLSFSGGSIHDGIRIIQARKDVPELILIETNFADRPAGKSFLEDLFKPVLFSLRSILPGLRQRHQPVNLLSSTSVFSAFEEQLGQFENIVLRKRLKQGSEAGGKTAERGKDEIERKKTLLKIAVQQSSRAPDKDKLASLLAQLKADLAALSDRGATFAFFEMPMHPEVYRSPRASTVRREFKRFFPEKDYRYFPSPECSEYETNDGYHLTKSSALAYSQKFAEKLAAFRLQGR